MPLDYEEAAKEAARRTAKHDFLMTTIAVAFVGLLIWWMIK